MAASSSSASFFDAQNQIQNSSAAPFPDPPPPPQQKKKRNQPRTPNSDVEVINLSPKTLMATNRFVCEVCKKGFQREQNLQLHRRGHNLPWKLKQKSHTEIAKRKVYVCPEPSCVHHDASRALGDLTGIKKHYYRKHGEKRWKCEKCSKRYAVQSDWKAHSKTCGTKEYRCDCGTLFSRRDSFITHRAFCDALAQETARHPSPMLSLPRHHHHHPYGSPSTGPNMILPGGLAHIPTATPHTTPHMDFFTHAAAAAAPDNNFTATAATSSAAGGGGLFMQEQDHHHHQDLYNLDFLPAAAADGSNAAMGNMVISSLFEAGNSSSTAAALSGGADNRISSSAAAASLFGHSMQSAAGSAAHHMSATALLQKAAQMGSSASAAGVFGEHGNSLQELMSSFSAGGGSRQAEEQNMTRDFLGVGQIVRTMSTRGGFMNQRRELQQSGDGNDVVTNSSSHPRF